MLNALFVADVLLFVLNIPLTSQNKSFFNIGGQWRVFMRSQLFSKEFYLYYLSKSGKILPTFSVVDNKGFFSV